MKIDETALILLASGLSRRFGSGNKLLAPLNGKPLIQHSIDQIKDLPFGSQFAVIGQADPELASILKQSGFICIKNPDPEHGQGHSISIGTHSAIRGGYSSVCICLGDMPFVSRDHILRLFEENQSTEMVFSRSGSTPLPPAIFSGAALQRLSELSGDQGAKSLLANHSGEFVEMSENMAIDVDTPGTLAALNNS